MKFSVKFQRVERGPWEHAPVLADSSEQAWSQFSAWRLATATDYNAATVQPVEGSDTEKGSGR